MKTLLFTGATGFLGKNISPVLTKHGYKITKLGSKNAEIVSNLSKEIPKLNRYDIVLHAAGKAHVVPKTEEEKREFFDINYKGTINLCNALEISGIPSAYVFISTVAVYGCEHGDNITEEHQLNGITPYALSKIKAEQYLIDWCKKNRINLTILRPSLIAGFDPPGNLGAMIKGIKNGRYFSIAGGKVKKSIVMANDIANLIPLVEGKGGIYNICDDECPSFYQIERLIAKQLGKPVPCSIPYFLAKTMAICGDVIGNISPINSNKLSKIVNSCTVSNEKIKKELGWKPLSVLDNFKIINSESEQ
jgi:nucleoside-diphosphate-sugar epimerase